MEWIQGQVISIGVGLVISFGLGWMITKLPDYFAKKFEEAFERLFAAGSAKDDKLFCSMLIWSEETYGPGTGEQKAKAVTGWLMAKVPLQYRIFCGDKVKLKVEEFFHKTFDRLEETALAQLKKNQIPPAI